jgi:glycosyltransferase involved in cell wall biosynthesis
MPKVSIIMPSLNVAGYIEKCMESVIKQTLKDIEIIVVDAGSNDGTLEILRALELQDHRVHIIHSDKRSYGYQVNLGISKACGDFIGIVETDDYIALNMYETLYSVALESKADYVKGSAERFFGVTDGLTYTRKIEVFSKKEFAPGHGAVSVNPSITPDLILRDYYLWTGIYKNNFVKSIRLNETPGAAYQDIGFLFQTFCRAQKAVYMDEIFYHYRQDNPNASLYNPNAFHYIVEEYQYADNLLQNQDEKWRILSYCKMFRQTNQRIRLMAVSGSVWDLAISDLQIISDKLKQGINGNPIASEHLLLKELPELELMIHNPISLYDYYITAETKKRRELSCLLEKMSVVNQIVIFGCGLFGEFVSVLLGMNGIDKVEACCDNNSDLWGNELQGKPIISPEQAVRDYPQTTYIVANKAHRQEIEKQLLSMGIADDHIYAYTLDADTLLLSNFYLQK